MKWSAGIVYQVDALKAVSARSGAFWGVLLLNGPGLHVRGRRSFQNVAPVKVGVTTQRGAAFVDRLPDRGGPWSAGAERLHDCRV